MTTLHLKNFGPIVDSGTLNLSTINLLIGPQGSGKSSVLKVLSLCTWLEKIIMSGRTNAHYDYTHYNRFVKELKNYYRLNDNYFSENTEIIYDSDFISIKQLGARRNAAITIKQANINHRHNSAIAFIPSERNLVSAVKNVERTYRVSDFDVLYDFIYEWGKTRNSFTKSAPLHLSSIKDVSYFYDSKTGSDIIHLASPDKTFSTFHASSGLQSALPVEALLTYKCDSLGTQAPVSIADNENIEKIASSLAKGDSDAQKVIISNLMTYRAVKLFIEEPEQNLFPDSQWELVQKIVRKIGRVRGKEEFNDSMAVLTTHSPYVLTALSILLLASKAFAINPSATAEVVEKELILPQDSFRGWYINNGKLETIIDSDLAMIFGDKLDGISETADNLIGSLNNIIYG